MKYITGILLSVACVFSVNAKELAKKELTPLVTSTEVIKIIVALSIVLVMVMVFAYLVRKLSGTSFGRNHSLSVIAGVNLGTKEKVILMQAGEKQLLIGVTQASMNTLHVFDTPIVNKKNQSEKFIDNLKQFMQKDVG